MLLRVLQKSTINQIFMVGWLGRKEFKFMKITIEAKVDGEIQTTQYECDFCFF